MTPKNKTVSEIVAMVEGCKERSGGLYDVIAAQSRAIGRLNKVKENLLDALVDLLAVIADAEQAAKAMGKELGFSLPQPLVERIVDITDKSERNMP